MCSACQQASGYNQNYAPRVSVPISASCSFNIDVITIWFNKLNCVKNNNLYATVGTSVPEINSALGIVQSALNYPSDPCFFNQQLTQLGPLMTLIVQKTTC